MREQERIAIANNIATNGRVFCALLCAICIAVYLDRRDTYHIFLAITSALPIGVSYLAEAINLARGMNTRLPSIAGVVNVLLPVVVILNLLIV